MQILKKIAFSTSEEPSGGEALSLSYRSSGATINTGNLCISETPDVAFYIYSTTKPVVTTGDIAYNTNNLSSPYNGANKYFNIAYADFIADDTYLVQIDSVGVMTVIDYCGT